MKIAISSTGEDVKSNVSDIFGRCPYFFIAEIKDNKVEKTEILKNEKIDQSSGVGVLVAQLMAEKNINAVITGNVGPRALDVLNQFDIEIYTGEGTVEVSLEAFMDKKLEKIN